ncbi:hypothetical protein LZ30DRAFT_301797 [Colletotrichum cereale]|nr:hypothetical protein LZ30DRAFT_301797 [Colletotrichum cereale]
MAPSSGSPPRRLLASPLSSLLLYGVLRTLRIAAFTDGLPVRVSLSLTTGDGQSMTDSGRWPIRQAHAYPANDKLSYSLFPGPATHRYGWNRPLY